MTQTTNVRTAPKRDWIRPGFQRLEAGTAESQQAGQADGGGGNQAS